MADYIDRQTAIAYAISGKIRTEDGENWIRVQEVRESLLNMPSQPEQRWIPISERLPEKSGRYYVSGGDKVWICEFFIIPNFTNGWCNDVLNPVVQAWMPLPKPYMREG